MLIQIIFIYAKDPYGAKYKFLINKREGIGLEEFRRRIIWTIFIEILKNIIQIGNMKY